LEAGAEEEEEEEARLFLLEAWVDMLRSRGKAW
jgi:hypothetical protein